MCAVVHLGAPADAEMTSPMTSATTTSYSTFSIASLIGHKVSGEGLPLLHETNMDDHPDDNEEDGVSRCALRAVRTSPSAADAVESARDDTDKNGRCE